MKAFKGRDIISLRDMTIEDLWTIVNTAKEVKEGGHRNCLAHKTIASLFFEPSTRTRLSFESAVMKAVERYSVSPTPGPHPRRRVSHSQIQ